MVADRFRIFPLLHLQQGGLQLLTLALHDPLRPGLQVGGQEELQGRDAVLLQHVGDQTPLEYDVRVVPGDLDHALVQHPVVAHVVLAQRAEIGQGQLVLLGHLPEDVAGDHPPVAEPLGQQIADRGLAGADGAADRYPHTGCLEFLQAPREREVPERS